MYQVIIIIHILLGLSIIGLILMQQGKGADAGATFGGGASGSVFGAQGAASFLSRTTAILATLFFATSLGLAWLNSHKNTGVNDLMSTTTTEKAAPDLGLPPIDAVKSEKAITPPPVVNKESAPTVPVESDESVINVPSVAQPAPVQPTTNPAKETTPPVIEEKATELKTEVPTKAPEKKKK